MRTNVQARALAIGMAVLLGGCAAVSRKQCEEANWAQLGRADGAAGLAGPGAEAGRLLERCESAGAPPDREAYDQGRRAGLGQWCAGDWAALGRDEGGRGVAVRDLVAATALCAEVGGSVNAPAYLGAYRQAAASFCGGLDWVAVGRRDAAAGRPLDAGAAYGACQAVGVSAAQRSAYEMGVSRHCHTLDWHALGRRQFEAGGPADAQAGSPPACSALGIRPDAWAFQLGFETARRDRRERLERQCTGPAMFDAGRGGRSFDRACAEVPAARRAHDGGRSAADLDREIRGLEAQRGRIGRVVAPPKQGSRQEPPPEGQRPDAQKSEELGRLNSRIRELTMRLHELERQFR